MAMDSTLSYHLIDRFPALEGTTGFAYRELDGIKHGLGHVDVVATNHVLVERNSRHGRYSITEW